MLQGVKGRLTILLVVIACGLMVVGIAQAKRTWFQVLSCGENTINIDQTVVRGAEGSQTLLARFTVPSNIQGKTVAATASAVNNNSSHPGTKFIISSDGTSFSINDVERQDNITTTASGQLKLGNNVDVTVQLGSDGVFSGGGSVRVTVDCNNAGPPPPSVQPPVPCSVDLAVVKTADRANYAPGDVANYSFDVANVIADHCYVEHTTLHDALPREFSASAVSDPRCHLTAGVDSQILDCDFGRLESVFDGGPHILFTVSGSMNTPGTVSNTACVSAGDQADSNYGNNCSTVVVQVTAPPPPAASPPPAQTPPKKAVPPVHHPKPKPPVHHPKPPKHHVVHHHLKPHKKHHPKHHAKPPKAPHYTP